MIIIESKRKKRETILRQYPGAIVCDVTSHAKDGLVKPQPNSINGHGFRSGIYHYPSRAIAVLAGSPVSIRIKRSAFD